VAGFLRFSRAAVHKSSPLGTNEKALRRAAKVKMPPALALMDLPVTWEGLRGTEKARR